MKILLTIFIVLTISYLTSNYAAERGRDRATWFLLGILFGIFALAAVFILPPLNKEEDKKSGASDLVSTPEPPMPVDTFAEHKWHFIDVNSKQKGPLDIEDLKIAWEDGLANEDAYVWSEGMSDWKKIKDVHGLVDRLQN